MPYLTIFSHKRLTKEENLFDLFFAFKGNRKKGKNNPTRKSTYINLYKID